MPRRSHACTAIAALLLAAALTACADETPAGPTGPPPAATATPSNPAGQPDLDAAEEVAGNLDVPWGLAFLPDGAALVAERDSGRILRIGAGRAPEQVYQVPGVAARGEGGLLGLAVAPDYTENPYIYAYFTAETDNRIVRFRLDGPPEVLVAGIAKAGNHNGGRIAFGPDGMLYAGTGDAGQAGRSQDPASLNGKILRVTADGRPAPGNPYPGSPVYSLGHRNVQGLAWDRDGRLFAAEFGQDRFDEINLIEPGHNYGWPDVEGSGGADRGFTEPLLTWTTAEASPSGIAVTGDTLYVAALRGRRLWTVPLVDGRTGAPRAELRDRYGRLRTVAVAPDGALWLTTSNTDGRGEPVSGDDRVLRFPAR
ncbi:PQQ-dependent sugar dehydrogenase [Nocardia araoensis]|uniref:PQQ-dependent sugar dehydrogenase n=1 Tax=Nocardia araoensis TaxID=228600 RepID=UPI00030F77DE|nr:PQQ-dependent sugar dehydrogenase [Nocardia araoensis]